MTTEQGIATLRRTADGGERSHPRMTNSLWPSGRVADIETIGGIVEALEVSQSASHGLSET